ncbi:MAG: hypothetical protein FJ125_00725 [Deltaproteobacteria bacterium]|nr:hypothetical protein [Deltaproteobacteria bacterium]
MTPRCSSWSELIERFHDGELSKKERARVEAHLEGCAGCRGYLARLAGMGRLVGLPAQDALSRVPAARLEAMWTRVAARLREEAEPSLRERLSSGWERFWAAHRWTVIAAAGAACLTLLVAWPLLRSMPGPGGGGGGTAAEARQAMAGNEVFVDSVQTGEHDMVLVNVHPEDMTTVIWLLNDGEEEGAEQLSPGAGTGSGAAPEKKAPPAPGSGLPAPAGGEPGPGQPGTEPARQPAQPE